MSSELPAPRRVVTAHRDDGVAVVKEDSVIPLTVIHIYIATNLSTNLIETQSHS